VVNASGDLLGALAIKQQHIGPAVNHGVVHMPLLTANVLKMLCHAGGIVFYSPYPLKRGVVTCLSIAFLSGRLS